MDVMFSGFDDGGWLLMVLGCRGVGGNQGWSKTGRKHQTAARGWGWRDRERNER